MTSNSLFPSFLDTANSGVQPNATRLAPLPANQQQQTNNVNGNGAAISALPIGAGQQMDVNLLYQKVLELSDILRENREKTQGIVAGAEELAVSRLKLDLFHTVVQGQLIRAIDQSSSQWSFSFNTGG